MSLAEFLAMAGQRRFQWGSWDCCLWLADWVLDQRGVDAVAEFRGRYRTRLGCARIVKRAGSLAHLVRGQAEAAGLQQMFGHDEPRPGDIGVIFATTAGGLAQAGAIKAGADRWAMLGERGLEVRPAIHIAAWRV